MIRADASSGDGRLDEIWRAEAPVVLAALLRRSGDFGVCEDAVAEAMLAAAEQWPRDGVPEQPRGWLIRVASRRLIDRQRADRARERREVDAVGGDPAAAVTRSAEAEHESATGADDSLQLLVLCCHPALTTASQVALTLRAVGGLTTAQIAAAFWVPEATMAQRISRAKAGLRSAGARFDAVEPAELANRLRSVRHVLYLIFNEGYTASVGTALIDTDLSSESIRLTEQLVRARPDDESVGLLALQLLTDARRPARLDAAGELVPLADQDRTRWDRRRIARGIGLVERVLPSGPVGPYQLQAAIAAVHAEATSAERTDWLQIAVLYRMLAAVDPSPMVRLNEAVAIGMAHGSQAGLAALEPLLAEPGTGRHHRVIAAHAHLLERAGDPAAAAERYRSAARATRSIPEQRYLNRRATELR